MHHSFRCEFPRKNQISFRTYRNFHFSSTPNRRNFSREGLLLPKKKNFFRSKFAKLQTPALVLRFISSRDLIFLISNSKGEFSSNKRAFHPPRIKSSFHDISFVWTWHIKKDSNFWKFELYTQVKVNPMNTNLINTFYSLEPEYWIYSRWVHVDSSRWTKLNLLLEISYANICKHMHSGLVIKF